MGRILQKKKNRSSIPKVKHKSKKAKNGNKKINALGNAIIAENWDRNLTFTQNYRRLGLTSRLNVATGGVEKFPGLSAEDSKSLEYVDPLHATLLGRPEKEIKPTEARVERDPETGRILRVIREENEDNEVVEIAGRKRRKANPLEDPIEDAQGPPGNAGLGAGVVSELERQAATEEDKVKKRKPRQQSKREIEWLESLVERYGDDTRAMARDKKLNRMQQTEGDIARRLRKWRDGK